MPIDTSKIVGSTSPDQPKLQPYKWGRTEKGRFMVIPYEGFDVNSIETLAAQADAYGLNYNAELMFGKKARLEVTYPYNFTSPYGQTAQTEITTVWEMIPKNELIDLLDARNPLVNSALYAEVTLLKDWRRTNTLETNITDSNGNFIQPGIPSTATPPGSPTPFSQAGTILAKYIYDGVLNSEVPAPTITYTSTVTNQYINPVTFTNLGRIISSAKLVTNYSVPSSVLFQMPSNSDPALIPIAGGYFQTLQYGWLIKSPSVRQLSAQKFSLSQSFDYGLWGIDLYGPRIQ
jgi:hypothetical protein